MLIGWIVEDYNNDKYTKQLIESIRSSGVEPIVTNNIDKVINDLDKINKNARY